MLLKVLQNPNKILRAVSLPVKKSELGTSELKDLIRDMSETLAHEGDGVALAAPQVGINKRIFIVSGKVFSIGKDDEIDLPDLEFINPEFIKISRDKKMMHEGCLSVRPLYGDIRRASRATVRAQNSDGHHFEVSGTGLLAEIFQHEIDHLQGILFIDKAVNIKDGEKRDLTKKKNKLK